MVYHVKGKGLLTGLFIWGLLFGTSYVRAETPRHLDPETLSGTDPYPDEVLGLYGELFDSIALENYSMALEVLAQGMEIEALPETRLILERYNELLLSEISSLNGSAIYLAEAADFLRYMQTEEADTALLNSISELVNANHTLGLLFEASIQLGNKLGVPQDELIDDLVHAVEVLEDYYSDYRLINETNRITESLIEEKLLVKTLIELDETSDSVLVGDLVYIRGRLSTVEGEGLSREIGFYSEGVYMGKAVSDSDGVFYVGFPAPEIYSGSVMVWAEYWPNEEDASTYTPTRSNQMKVEIRYHTPDLAIDYPDVVYLGLPFNISGSLAYGGEPLEGYWVNLSSDDQTLWVQTGVDGDYSFTWGVHEKVDVYILNMTSMPRGNIGPTTHNITLDVSAYPVDVEVQTSGLNFGGGYLTITGNANSSDPDANYLVSFQGVSGKYSVSTSGEFRIRVPLSLFASTSWNSYQITVKSSPWLEQVTVSGRYFSINPIIPILFALTCSYLYINRDRVRGLLQKEDIIATDMEPIIPVPEVSPSGLELFFQKLMDILGISFKPDQTLREFLAVIAESLSGGLLDRVRSLILAYERRLYGPPGKKSDDLDGLSMDILGRLSDED